MTLKCPIFILKMITFQHESRLLISEELVRNTFDVVRSLLFVEFIFHWEFSFLFPLFRSSKCNLYSFIIVWKLIVFLVALSVLSLPIISTWSRWIWWYYLSQWLNFEDLNYNFVIWIWIFDNRCYIFGFSEYYSFLINFVVNNFKSLINDNYLNNVDWCIVWKFCFDIEFCRIDCIICAYIYFWSICVDLFVISMFIKNI